jgi:hypothetical protein
MSKNCRLADKTDTRCCQCVECLYLEDKKRRPWIYESDGYNKYLHDKIVFTGKVLKIEDKAQSKLDQWR